MKAAEIRQKFLEFFKKRDHTIIPSASLVPENDPSVLFNTAGMQPLVPYLLGEPHPAGKRIANVQKCVRTQDIEEVGDNTHDTFFEMLGNWSLGDYFKQEAITWSYELLTSKDEGFGLDPSRLYITVFAGNDDAPRDEEAAEIWKSIGVPEHRIYYLADNWWSPGDNGPCGPDSEMFYDVTGTLGDMSHDEFLAADDKQQVVEVWNDVFMEYEKKDGKVIGKLSQKNVDTGAGLERLVMALQGKDNIFDTDLFSSIMEVIPEGDLRARRIVADHMRTAVMMAADGVIPSNTDRGYILRRLIRRAVRYSNSLGLSKGMLDIINAVADVYRGVYPNVDQNIDHIKQTVMDEVVKFGKTLQVGLREFEKGERDAFKLFSTYGFPLEMTKELTEELGETIDESKFNEQMRAHQDESREGSGQKFKGGLADHSEMSVKYHTATHLLHQALRTVLGDHVFQKGSNITADRLRFDFSHDAKMTDEEKSRVEELVNEQISRSLPVSYEDIPIAEAEKRGAIGLFEENYGDRVRVYQIGEGDEQFSLEFCGGPHVSNTSELGEGDMRFKIKKEEAVAQGVRRIKALLVPNN